MFSRCAGLLLLSLSLGQAEEPAAIVEQPITDADREHWAWRWRKNRIMVERRPMPPR